MSQVRLIAFCHLQYSILWCTVDNYGLRKGADMRFTWGLAPELFQLKWNEKRKYWTTLCVKQTERHNQGVNKEMSSVFADQERPRIRVQMQGGNEYSCEHCVTWSPNKLWRSTSIFNLWAQYLQSAKPRDILYINRCHFFKNWRKVSKWKDKEIEKASRGKRKSDIIQPCLEQLIKTVTDRSGAAKRLVLCSLPPAALP